MHLPILEMASDLRIFLGIGVKYCYAWDEWLVWDGRRWAVNAEAEGNVCTRYSSKYIF